MKQKSVLYPKLSFSVSMVFTVSTLLGLVGNPSIAKAQNSQVTSSSKPLDIAALTSMVAQNNGPNCFNAALVAKGYLPELVGTSEDEFVFFLDRFCKEKPKFEISSGDILVHLVASNPGSKLSISHAIYAVSPDAVFEKYSQAGKGYAKNDIAPDSGKYLNHAPAKSWYLNGGYAKLSYGVEEFKSYNCEPAETVRKTMQSINEDPTVQKLFLLRTALSKASFIKSKKELKKFVASEIVPRTTDAVNSLSNIADNTVTATYRKALTWSLSQHLRNLGCQFNLHSDDDECTSELGEEYYAARIKLFDIALEGDEQN